MSLDSPRDRSAIDYLHAKFPENFEFRSGKKVEEYDPSDLGPADLITDVFGPMSYSPKPTTVLARYHGFLKVGGRVYFNLIRDRYRAIDSAGQAIALESLLHRLKGYKVVLFNIKGTPEGEVTVGLERTTDDFSAPAMELIDLIPDFPPEMTFQLQE